MIECSVNNISKFYGANKIFENISFELKTNQRIGLIGQNGCGKTTLMKVLIGVENYHSGSITFRKGVKLGYLDQIYECSPNTTVLEILEESFQDIWVLKNKLKAIEENLKHLKGNELEIEMRNYGLLLEQYEIIGGYNVETNINMVCQGLMIPDEFRDKPFQMLSGGEKTRVLLGRLLLQQPDILLLDEPTNHLDIRSIEWLEDFLSTYEGTVLIISHDRHFLDKVVTRIIELEPTVANLYHGNYSAYAIEKEIRFDLEYRAYINNQRKIEQMEKQIERYRIWGAMRDSDKMYRRAKEIEKRLDKVEVLDRPTFESPKIRLGENNVERTGKIVLKAENLAKSFPDKNLFTDLSFTLFYQDRLCIMGENGSGKTTFLKILLGDITSDGGSVVHGSNVKIGYLPQNVSFEDEDLSILDYFMSKHNITQSEARSQLAKMLFIRDDVYKNIKSLSGGEKSRLKLSSLIHDKVNFMILDEPTNHLDIDSREILEDRLTNYTGTILFVSHDRYFVDAVATRMMIFNKNEIQQYSMNYSEYLEVKQNEVLSKPIKKENKAPKKPPIKPNRRPNNTYKIKQTEKEIEELEEKLQIIEKEMSIYNDDGEKLYQLFEEKENLEKNLDLLVDLWGELQGDGI